MRKQITELINSNISPFKVSTLTGVPRNTAYRIFNGEASLDNITLKNAERLAAYSKVKTMLEQFKIKRSSTIEYWAVELLDQQHKFAGIKNIVINELIFTDDSGQETTNYGVGFEEKSLIVQWSEGSEKVIEALITNATYVVGTVEYIASFTSLLDAKEYATHHYPNVDLKKKIEDYFLARATDENKNGT